MSRIRSKDTEPEMMVRQFLHKHGFRFRLHVKDLAGKPDIVLPRHKTVIFVNGCFWHGHENCKYYKSPQTRTEWWKEKIERNRTNDIDHQTHLKGQGYKVLVIWECEVKNDSYKISLIDDIRR